MVNIIKQTLDFLKKRVDTYNGSTNPVVEISNIATLNDGDEFLNSTSPIVLSIVNIEEDKISRNPKLHQWNPVDHPNIEKLKNPTQHFRVSVLFTAYNKVQTNDKYLDGISKLEHVLRCFQEQRVFYLNGSNEVNPLTNDHIKVILDIESLNFNELNQMWSVLGSKYMPSVLYRMRMIPIQNDNREGDKVIDKFKVNLWNNDPHDPHGHLEITDDITL